MPTAPIRSERISADEGSVGEQVSRRGMEEMSMSSGLIGPFGANATGTNAFRILPEFNGVRGLGVSLVVIGHVFSSKEFFLTPSLMDLFFVYSAFFISRIFFNTDLSLRNTMIFLVRRAWRIWPLYFVVMPVCLSLEEVSHLLNFGPGQHRNISEWLQFFTFTQYVDGYFQHYAPNNQLLLMHTWSLAVEEQLYLLWPLALAALILVPRLGLLLLLVLAGLSIWARHHGVASHLLVTRLDSFAIGTFAALTLQKPVMTFGRHRISWTNIWAAAFGASAVLCVSLAIALYVAMPEHPGAEFAVGFDDNPELALVFRLWYGMAAGAIWLTSGHPIWRPLRNKTLGAIGALAYYLYLIHMPVILLVAGAAAHFYQIGLTPSGIISIPVTLLLSVAWYRWVDTPLENRRKRLRYGTAEKRAPSLGALNVITPPAA